MKLLNPLKNIISLITFSVIIHIPFQLKAQSNGFEYIKSMELMDLIYQHLDMYFVDEPKPGKMSKTAIDAMLHELDPYTVYYHESNMEDYRLMTTGEYGGIGALIRKIGDFTFIADLYEGNPAQKSGLLAGDKILSIDGKDMKSKPSDDVSSFLRGPKGSKIELTILRNDKEKLTIPIVREEIKLPDVPYTGMLDENIGYIKLNSFTQTASSDVKKAFQDLKSQGLKELILDLRGNGGGLLIEAVKIVNLFVKKGQTIVSTKGRVSEENYVYKTLEEPLDTSIPLVVLVDEGSASASEIVAGSLQDLDRAVIIGNTTYGKGLVQRTYDLKYGSKLKLTIAKYYTPSGRCVQKLEYYEKPENERPKEIPDSLIKVFKTTNGRSVIDGRGIEPDIKVDEEEYSRLTAMLVANNLIFHYATDFYYKNKTIPDPGKFKLSDVDYESFKLMALKDTFNYSTASEEVLKKMREIAIEENYFEDAEIEYKALLNKVTPSKERDLEKFNSEIKEFLENEIVARYYFQRGRIIDSFKDDECIKKSKEVLKDINRYNIILN